MFSAVIIEAAEKLAVPPAGAALQGTDVNSSAPISGVAERVSPSISVVIPAITLPTLSKGEPLFR